MPVRRAASTLVSATARSRCSPADRRSVLRIRTHPTARCALPAAAVEACPILAAVSSAWSARRSAFSRSSPASAIRRGTREPGRSWLGDSPQEVSWLPRVALEPRHGDLPERVLVQVEQGRHTPFAPVRLDFDDESRRSLGVGDAAAEVVGAHHGDHGANRRDAVGERPVIRAVLAMASQRSTSSRRGR